MGDGIVRARRPSGGDFRAVDGFWHRLACGGASSRGAAASSLCDDLAIDDVLRQAAARPPVWIIDRERQALDLETTRSSRATSEPATVTVTTSPFLQARRVMRSVPAGVFLPKNADL
jgi:hypothetical protein